MRKYIIEFIGTFFLVLIIALTGNPLAIGAGVVGLVYFGGYISGAHYNPAVTLALWMSKKIKSYIAIRYMLTQLLAAITASAFYYLITYKTFTPHFGPGVSMTSALIIEVLFTFLLCSVVLHAAATDKTKDNDYFGLAIGLTVMAGAFAAGPISGAAFNPAVGVGPLLYDFGNLASHTTELLTYIIGPFLGGSLASIVYKNKL